MRSATRRSSRTSSPRARRPDTRDPPARACGARRSTSSPTRRKFGLLVDVSPAARPSRPTRTGSGSPRRSPTRAFEIYGAERPIDWVEVRVTRPDGTVEKPDGLRARRRRRDRADARDRPAAPGATPPPPVVPPAPPPRRAGDGRPGMAPPGLPRLRPGAPTVPRPPLAPPLRTRSAPAPGRAGDEPGTAAARGWARRGGDRRRVGARGRGRRRRGLGSGKRGRSAGDGLHSPFRRRRARSLPGPASTTEDLAVKKDIHPEYYPVVFVDSSAGFEFTTHSTKKSGEVRKIDGVDHYVLRVEISSASHPFYTGKQKFVDAAGRIEKFQKKYGGVYGLHDEGRRRRRRVGGRRPAKSAKRREAPQRRQARDEVGGRAPTRRGPPVGRARGGRGSPRMSIESNLGGSGAAREGDRGPALRSGDRVERREDREALARARGAAPLRGRVRDVDEARRRRGVGARHGRGRRRSTPRCARWRPRRWARRPPRVDALLRAAQAHARGRRRRRAARRHRRDPRRAPAATRRRSSRATSSQMYEHLAKRRGWRLEILDGSQTDHGGFKSDHVLAVAGPACSATLRFESGVHRVQRVPETETAGPHPHEHRHRGGPPRGRGGGRRDPPPGHRGGVHARRRPRRAEREQDVAPPCA